MAITGMFKRFASFTAFISFWMSTIKSALGSLLRSAIEPKFFSSFALWRVTCSFSRFASVSKVPSDIILSMVFIFLTAFRMVGKLVNIPPGQRSVTYGIFIARAFSATISLACFFVATKRILRPARASCFITFAASSILITVLCRSIM